MTALEPIRNLPLFVYGDALDPDFVSQLLERRVHAESTSLFDFELLEFPGETPVICEAPGKSAPGRLYRHLSVADYERLDAYMGVAEGLHRRTVTRVTADGSEEPSAKLEGAFLYIPLAWR